MRSAWLTACACIGAVVLALGGASARAEPPASDFLTVDGVRIHYLEQGHGPPVVLVHGWMSSARLNWEQPGIMAALAREHRVIALDLPGYGRSDRPAAPKAYGAQWIDDIAQLLDRLGIERAHVVGYSMGGMVALKFAVDRPDRVLSVALGGMGLLRRDGPMVQDWARRHDTASRSVVELALTPEQVRAVRVPVEVVVGSDDPVRQLYVAPLLAVRGDWPVVEIAGANHVSILGKPQFAEELRRWLERQRAP